MQALLAGNWTDQQVLTKHTVMNSAHHAVLHTLFDLARNDHHATVLRVAAATQLAKAEVLAALSSLEAAGLVDASRVRLTLAGLTTAVAIGRPRVAARRSAVRRAA